jgi:eukaryotic-like serine/threonine-protein kinase
VTEESSVAVPRRGLASAPLDSESARELVQRRIALLARVCLIFGLLIQATVRWVAFSARETSYGAATDWTPNAHLVVLAMSAAVWLRARSSRRSPRELALLDFFCVMPPVAFSLIALWQAPPDLKPDLLNTIGAGDLLILRAVLVPSTGRRTAVLGAGIAAAIVVWTYAYYSLHPDPSGGTPLLHVVTMTTWCSMAVIVSTLASHTIFGLRQKVREAAELGQYTLLKKLGEGGMGEVYEARHALLRRRTAVKLLPPHKAGEHDIARFEREVQLTAALTHPNTVAIYDYGHTPDGVFYYAMEFLEGLDLQHLVDNAGPQPPGVVAYVLEQVCNALVEAHSIGLIHRDIKPANIVLCERGGTPLVAKVVDFGLVKRLSETNTSPELSATNAVMGTPLYLSPEAIAKPEAVDSRSDLYALGCVGYFLLTATPVFESNTTVELCAHHLHTAPDAPSARLGRPIPEDLEAIVLDCLQKDPDKRPRTAADLAERLASTAARRDFTRDDARAAWQRVRRRVPTEAPTRTAVASARLLTVELKRRAASGR